MAETDEIRAIVTNGTDAPVEDVDPIASYYATVTRRAADGTVFYGDQRMSRIEALRSYRFPMRLRPSKRTSRARSPAANSPT